MTYDLNTMTAQEVFDACAKHLIEQGKKSEDGRGMCRYRGPNDLKCAAGIFISDEAYEANRGKLEERGWHGVSQTIGLGYAHCELVQYMQRVHDDAVPGNFVGSVVSSLRELASLRGLNTNVLDLALKVKEHQCTQ